MNKKIKRVEHIFFIMYVVGIVLFSLPHSSFNLFNRVLILLHFEIWLIFICDRQS